jgi:hypothetical protein
MIPSGTNNPPASRIVHKLVMNIAEILLPWRQRIIGR